MLIHTPVLLRILMSHPRLLACTRWAKCAPAHETTCAGAHAQVRLRDAIPGSTVRDCCVSFWCCCCSTCQLARHEGLTYDNYGGVFSPTGEKMDAGMGCESAGRAHDMNIMMARV